MTEKTDWVASENIVRTAYNNIAKQYDSARDRYQNDLQLGSFLKYLPKKSKTILDAGCGSGKIMSTIAETGMSIVGIDFSKEMLSLSKENAPNCELLEMDVTSLAFKEEIFDGIVAMYSTIHIPKTKHGMVFKSFRRVLRPEGCFLISLGIDELEVVEEYKPFGVINYWSNEDSNVALGTIKELGFEILFDRILEQGGERFYWIIGRKVK